MSIGNYPGPDFFGMIIAILVYGMPVRRLIIIDDNIDQRFVLKGLLTDIGCEVIGEGSSGLDAMELMQKLAPDAVLMDVKLPGMDGIEAAMAINKLQPTPVILLTAKKDEETIKRAADAGVMAYLVKPIRQEDLLPAIELAISRFTEFQLVTKQNLELKESIEARKVIEKAKGLLMEKEGLSERAAFSYIQKVSMDKRRPMQEIAEMLISALKGDGIMSSVLVLQHVESEGLGIIENALRQKGVRACYIKIFKGEKIPRDTDVHDGLIILGGPMGVYEEDIYPFIKDELMLIKTAIKNNIPILGICLGAQMLAKAAGADVYKGKKKEIGWYKVKLSDEGKRDSLFIGLPEEFTVFQWHGDTFDIPANSKCLASSELFPNQIIKAGSNAYGLQFHLEVTEDMIKNWINLNDGELDSVKSYINPKNIINETANHIKTIHKYGEIVFLRFLGLLNR